MSDKIFYLSHTSIDKPVVRQVYDLVGRDRCWLDEGELRLGIDLLKQIDKGIADSRAFVLFWSRNLLSSNSEWVNEEIAQARVRAIRDKGYRFVVVTLDDTDVPVHLSTRYYIRAHGEPSARIGSFIADKLRLLADDLGGADRAFGKPLLRETFQDREQELDQLEHLASGPGRALLVQGMEGMGKTSLVKSALRKLWPQYLPVWVDLGAEPLPVHILASIARVLCIPVERDRAASEPLETWRRTLLPELMASRSVLLVLDEYPTERDTMTSYPEASRRLLSDMVADVVGLGGDAAFKLVLISSGRIEATTQVLSRIAPLRVSSLPDKDMSRALRILLANVDPALLSDERMVDSVAQSLRGYPLLLTLAAQRVAEIGPEAFLADRESLNRILRGAAQGLMSKITFSQQEKNALVLLGVAERPLSSEQLARIDPSVVAAMSGLSSKLVTDMTSEGFALHPLLREYVQDNMSTPDERKQAHSALASFYDKEWRAAIENSAQSAEMGSLAYYHCAASGDTTNASQIAIAFEEEAKAAVVICYRRADYRAAAAYAEGVMKIAKGTPDPLLVYYYALALNRMSQREKAYGLMKSLEGTLRNPSQYWHGRGTVERSLRMYPAALASFRKSITESGGRNSSAFASAAAVLSDEGRYEEAWPFVSKALDIAPAKSFILSIAATVKEGLGDFAGALRLIEDALRSRPNDQKLHHRAGMLLKHMGQADQARTHLEKALAGATSGYTVTALADVYLSLGDYDEAEHVLGRFGGNRAEDASYQTTMAHVLRMRGDFIGAERMYRRAIQLEPDNQIHYGGMASLKIDEAREAIKQRNRELAVSLVEEAEDCLQKATDRSQDEDAYILLDIDRTLVDLKKRLGIP